MPTPPWISSGPPQPNRPRRRTATDWFEILLWPGSILFVVLLALL